MYTLQRENVVKLTDSEVKRDKYIAEGFHIVESVPVDDTEGNSPDTEGKSAKKKA